MKMIRKLHLMITVSLLIMASCFEAGSQVVPYNVTPIYDGVSESSQYIESYDGTRLAITVLRPTLGGRVVETPLPIILFQMRGGVEGFLSKTIRYFTDRGYVWVFQDRRGTGASFGFETGFIDKNVVKDAMAVIEWAGAQPFCNQKAVALGCSNQGAWQYVTAAKAPKYLVAIAPACASPQFFDHGVALNGINIFPVGAKPFAGKTDNPAPTSGRFRPMLEPKRVDTDTDGSLLKAAIAEHAGGASMLEQYWLNMPRDGFNEYAGYRPALEDSAITHSDAIRKSGIAILQLMGWFDAAVAGVLEGQRQWGGRVVMGPWIHSNNQPKGADYPNGDLDLNAEMLRWFDFYAKGIQNGADKKSGILYYTINAPAGTEWREIEHWPPVGQVKTTYYLTAGGLSPVKADEDGTKAVYSPQDVVWFGDANKYSHLVRWWNGDMNDADAKSLSHTSDPLTSSMEVTGTPVAKLWVSADAPDINVFAVLEDVSPDGKSTYVTDGRLRASWRKLNTPEWGESDQSYHRGFAEDIAPLAHGEPAELVFDFFPISYVFGEGHRLRISIATSLGQAHQSPPLAGGKAATLTLYRDARRPSTVILPVIESARSKGASENEAISGKLADGTSYRVSKPENWNEVLVLDLDGAMPARGFASWLLDHDYARGGTTRVECGYNFPNCVDNLAEVRRLFTEQFGAPKWTIVTGGSRGAFVARLALERHPELFDAAMSFAGGGAGSIATMNSKLDAVWTLKTLVNPASSLRLVNITNVEEENAALSALLEEALATPQGRARLSLAAAFEQFALWVNPNAPEPDATDYEAQIDQIASRFVFANPAIVREGMERVAGGNICWNNGVDYRRLLELSGRKEMVTALYRKANLDLESDLAALERSERISADSAALGRAEPLMTYTGRIFGPIIVVDNDDPVDGAPLKLAYVETLNRAGTQDLLRLCWVRAAGHGGQTDIERIAGFVTLINRIEKGKWGDTSPAAMNTLAEKVANETSMKIGAPRFFEYNPPKPLRTWDVSNWGTYSPGHSKAAGH